MFKTRDLILWFRKHKRDLPWRRARSPYRTWISEMMLQQTRVDTVIPYFDRWMREIPDLESLHKTPLEKVLTLWQGLGYYGRARSIKRGADFLWERHKGEFPRKFEEMIRIPGIGPYSAGAILSLAFNQRVPIVDGNILRVYARLFAIKKAVNLPQTHARIKRLVEDTLPRQNVGEFNEALMELGALVCVPRNPKCEACPLRNDCSALRLDLTQKLPLRTRKQTIEKIQACAFVLRFKNRFLIQRRPEGERMGGLWEFPEWKIPPKKARLRAKSCPQTLSAKLGLTAENLKHIASIKRHYTRFEENLSVFGATLRKRIPPPYPSWPHRWVTKEKLDEFPFSSAHAKIRALISEWD